MSEPSGQENNSTALVRDYMTPDLQTLGANDTLLDAFLLLRRANLRHIPIIEDGKLVGMLTEGDVARAAPSLLVPLTPEEYNRVFEATEISKVMTKNLLTVAPDVPLAEAANLLHANRVGCLPVVEDGTLVGIITASDMLRALQDMIVSGSPATPPPDSTTES